MAPQSIFFLAALALLATLTTSVRLTHFDFINACNYKVEEPNVGGLRPVSITDEDFKRVDNGIRSERLYQKIFKDSEPLCALKQSTTRTKWYITYKSGARFLDVEAVERKSGRIDIEV